MLNTCGNENKEEWMERLCIIAAEYKYKEMDRYFKKGSLLMI